MTPGAAQLSLADAEPAPPGLLHPLRHPAFALIAGATLVSNIGVWMRDTTSAWTVANEAAHHSSVTLVQAATMIPTFLPELPAGVLADHFDRRRILILCQIALAAAGAMLAALSYAHALSIGAIVAVALFAGSAAALGAPAFQAIVPALVPVEDIRPAVALSSVSFNIARVIGPAAGGVLLAAIDAGSILIVAVLSAAKRRRVSDDKLLAAGSGIGAAALAILAFSREPVLASIALALAGGATLIQLANLNAAAQLILPDAIRGRGLSLYLATTFGSMAVGSLLWGGVSDTFSIGVALLLGAAGFALASVMGRYARLGSTTA